MKKSASSIGSVIGRSWILTSGTGVGLTVAAGVGVAVGDGFSLHAGQQSVVRSSAAAAMRRRFPISSVDVMLNARVVRCSGT
jgi:F0F1-type ATP synthase membrane subunit c/vacuolar-type H+-ATPase subunit K